MRTYKSHRCIGALHTVTRAGKKPATHYSNPIFPNPNYLITNSDSKFENPIFTNSDNSGSESRYPIFPNYPNPCIIVMFFFNL